ncbi:AAA family ATPase [Nocardioides cheoyonin]|uniref:bifunctional aminoglycoside phosphotransferase/ATP-binding protein n=1 Tax=Nocardioides cheoyonin TaxID=3156615 RepID=UPI0032B337A6
MSEPTPYADVHETHSGVVLLIGSTAYKLKKAVDLGFLDFRDVETRRRVCRRELELNRRIAPDVYVDVAELPSAEPGVDGGTEPAVVMRRMPEQRRLTALVARGEASRDDLHRIARVVAAFHKRAERGDHIAVEGRRDQLRERWENNLRETERFRGGDLDAGRLDTRAYDEVARLARRYLAGREALFDARADGGRVVDGHGDLLAGDIFLLDDGPRILDCLEFDDRLRYLDVLDDIACLAMDLERLGAREESAELVAAYLGESGEVPPGSLVHHYIAYRAFMRAKVAAVRREQAPGDRADGEPDALCRLALEHLRRAAVRLVVVGGAPGTGKSTVAGGLADRLGMVVLSSDRVRKELAGVDPDDHTSAAAFGEGIYAPEWTRRTYAELLDRAAALLARGESVVLDASWSDPEDRRHAAALAETAYTDLTALRCVLDPGLAADRIRRRQAVSDADEQIASLMRDREQPWPGAVELDTAGALDDTVDRAVVAVTG